MKAKQFIGTGFFFVVLFFLLYVLLFFYQLGAPVKSYYWIQHMYQYKDYRAKSLKGKKILILSGSNSLFGINSKLIQEKTGYPVANLAVNGGLDISFLYYKIKVHMNQGDIVVMPLEFQYYTPHSEKFTKEFSDGMMCWGVDYLKQLNYIDLLKFIIAAEPSRVIEGSIEQFRAGSVNTKVLSQQKVLDSLNKLWKEKGVKWRGYTHKSLNKYGEFNVDKAVTYVENYAYLDTNTTIPKHFLETYRKIKDLVKERNGTLILTYQPTLKNKDFNMSKQESQQRIENFETALSEHGIDIYCNAALFNLDRVYFFDRPEHTNKYGALIRSENLADCLQNILNEENTDLSYDEAFMRVKKLQNKYIDLVKKPNSYIRSKDQSKQ